MKCPACPTVSLVMADRSGIEIDYCPDCRGVWLDRGELDKIIERSTPTAPASPPPPPATNPGEYTSDGRPVSKPRKKGFLGDLFEF